MEVDLFNPERLNVMMHVADKYSRSSLLPQSLRGKPQDILIILQMGAEFGLKPLQAINMINVIQGKPSVSSQGMIALIRQRYPAAIIKIELDDANIVAKCTMGRCQEDTATYTSTWDMKRATKMELAHRPQYKKQPLNMLKWRAVSDAARTVFPDVISGLYTEDEVNDFSNHKGEEKSEPTIIENEDLSPFISEIFKLSKLVADTLTEDEQKMFKTEIIEVEEWDELKVMDKHQLENIVYKLTTMIDEEKNKKPSFKLEEKE